MLAVKKRLAVKAAIIFLSIMIFFTFSSRTINYIMTPKVIVSEIESGYLARELPIAEILLVSEKGLSMNIPFRLDTELKIGEIFVKPGQKVKKGDRLLSFDEYAFNELMGKLEESVTLKEIEMSEFTRSLSERTNQLEKEIKDLVKQLGEYNELKAEAKRNKEDKAYSDYSAKCDDLEYRIEAAQNTLKYIETTGILNGKSGDMTASKLEKEKKRLDILKSMLDGNAVISPVDGIVSGLHAAVAYRGLDALLGIIPDGEEMLIAVYTSSSAVNGSSYEFKADEPATLKVGAKQVRCTYAGSKEVNGKKYILLNPRDSESMKLVIDYMNSGKTAALLEINGNFYNRLVSNSAFISQNEIYILNERNGFWGAEFYISKLEVVKGASNEHFTQITSILPEKARVVISWDRELKDGQTVLLPLE